ncbi:MAG: hypothetical protein LUD72_07345, partial [Bacteroidales bacterium]|nr:hypothetical protein [Bacteroidales bacterium]
MVWKVLLAAVVFIGLCVVGLCFNILFRRHGKFPESDIGRNPELRKRGIRCVNEDEGSLPGGSVDVSGDGCGDIKGRRTLPEGFDCGSCTACDLYKISKKRVK